MAVATYTKTGTKATTAAKLPTVVFSEEVKTHDLLKEAYVAYMANGRTAIAHTKGRADVRGGGRKPWQQKGTGRARHGSIRSPIWRGGGITFGPTSAMNFSKKLNKKAKHKAIRQALSLAVKDNLVTIIEDVVVKDGKTREMAELLKKIDINRTALLIVDTFDEKVERASRNIPFLTLKQAQYVNVFEILNAHHIVITKKALPILESWLAESTVAPSKEKGSDE